MTSGRRPGPVAVLAGSAALVAGLTLLSRFAGFGRVFVFSGTVGAGCTGTSYAAANQLPNVLFEVVAGGALAGAVVPLVAGALGDGRREDADRTAAALLTWTVLVLTPLAALLALVAGPLAALLLPADAPGACPDGAASAARMLVLFSPQVVLYGVGVVLTGILQAHRRFAWPAVAPLLSSVVVVATYLVHAAAGGAGSASATDRSGELVLGVGTTLGVAALSLPLLLPVRATGTRLRPTLAFPPGVARRIRGLALAGVAALLAQQLAVLVTLALATRVGGTGVVNVVQYAQAVYLLPFAVLVVPLATAAFPQLSEQAARGDGADFARTVAGSTRAVIVLGVAGAALLVAVAPAVQVFFSALDRAGGPALAWLGDAVTGLAGGLVGWGLVAHVGRALYARGAGRAAATATASGWLAVVVASVACVTVLGASPDADPRRAAVLGLAWGSSAGMSVAGVLLVLALRRTAGPEAVRGAGRSTVLAAAAALAAVPAGRLVVDAVLPAATRTGAPAGDALPAAAAAGVAGALVVLAVLAVLLLPTELASLRDRLRPRGAGRP